jgi:hypothetical protein
MLAQNLAQVLGSDSLVGELHPLIEPRLQLRRAIFEVEDRDALGGHFDVLQQNGQSALRHSAKAHEKHPSIEWQHPVPPSSHQRNVPFLRPVPWGSTLETGGMGYYGLI